MTVMINHERDVTVEMRSRDERPTSTARVTTFTFEIPEDTVAFREMIVEEISDLTSPLSEMLTEIFQSIHILASEEDEATLLEFSIGILVVHLILSHALSPVWDIFSMPSSEIETSLSPPTRLIFKFIHAMDLALTSVDRVANYDGKNFTSFIKNGNSKMIDDGSDFSVFSPISLGWASTKLPSIISPTAFMIIGPLAVITLTCIMADNKYYLFATIFAPAVDRVLLRARSFVAPSTSNRGEWQQRRIPDDGETSEGVLWGMLALFCLESLLVGSIVLLMVLISVSLTIIASLSTVVSTSENPELLEETTKILVVFLCSWAICVVTTNVLRMVLYQAIGEDD